MHASCKNRATLGRRLSRLVVVVLSLLCAGCASVPFLGNSKEQTLRKQVEADSFPTAGQAGL